MQEKVLTIIVPSYNTSGFINKNIPTFLDESILDELEVLIIDDGSTDSTYEIAKRFEDQYPDTVRVVSKENGGHGSAINVGIQMAVGIYMKVVDGDDWVLTDNLLHLIKDLKEQNADVVINPYQWVYAGTKQSRLISIKSALCGKDMRFQDAGIHAQYLKLPSITYKTELLRKNGICVREKIYYEDNEYSLFPVPFINLITVLDYPVYQYLVAQNNQSVSNSNFLKNQYMFYTIVKDCIAYYEKWRNELSEDKRMLMKNAVMNLIRSQYNIYLRVASDPKAFEDLRQFNQDFQRNYREYFVEIGKRDIYVGIVQKEKKLLFLAVSLAMKVYRFLLGW